MGAFARVLPLRPEGRFRPLFCLPPIIGLGWGYAGLIRHIHQEQPIFSLQLPDPAQEPLFPKTLEGAALDFMNLIRGIQPAGPYYLLGWSFGGTLAHIGACLLQEAHETLGMLAVLDSYPMVAADNGTVPMPDPDPEDAELKDKLARLHGWSNHFKNASFSPKRFDGDMLLITTPENANRAELWTPYVSGKIIPHLISCKHPNLTQPGPIDEIGRILEHYLVNVR